MRRWKKLRLKTNLEAANEIARQLRLRDMGGIIVVDFIDLKKAENRKILNDHLKKVMKQDRAKHSILPISKFGLVQITRQRVRPQIDIQTSEVCPSCNGTGKIQASILIADEISNNIDFLIRQNKERKLSIKVNPYVGAFLKRGLFEKLSDDLVTYLLEVDQYQGRSFYPVYFREVFQ